VRRSVLPVVCLIALGLIAACDDEKDLIGPRFSCDITNPIRDFLLTPSNASLVTRIPAGDADTLQLRVIATNRFGELRADIPVEFSSSDPAIATVDTLGVVHAVAPGTVTIKAAGCDKTASAIVTVVRAVVTVQVVPEAQSVVAGDSVLITARAIDQAGDTLTDVRFTFTVSPSGAATVKQISDNTAYLFTTAAGNLTVTANGEGATASTVITVLPRAFLPNGLAAALANGGLDAGRLFTCGLITLGRAYCWGLNGQGQLGAASDSLCFETTITQITNDSGIVVSASRPCSLLAERSEPVDTATVGAPDISFSSISAGDSTACAIASTGRAYCWGYGTNGEVGNGTAANSGRPTLVTAGLTFTAVSVGGNHACGLATGGIAYCWGRDSEGQLGDARLINSTTPIPVVSGESPAVFNAITAGGFHSCALASGGAAFCWGGNNLGQLGNGGDVAADVPVAVAGGLSFVSISAGLRHSCGIVAGGGAWCWGSNSSGQLGIGFVGGASTVPVAVAAGVSFTRISAGGLHTCGLTTGGAIYCWGENRDLQLGRGPFTGSAPADGTPAQVGVGELPTGVTFASVTAGENHSCGVGSDGAAYCWGSNVFGALGNTLQAAYRGYPQRVATPR
jgi:alpha-tubulin suppressor-like RCC1 family protein